MMWGALGLGFKGLGGRDCKRSCWDYLGSGDCASLKGSRFSLFV